MSHQQMARIHASPTGRPTMPTAPTPKTVNDQRLAMIGKSAALAGHTPNSDTTARTTRILNGTLTADAAIAELDAKYAAG
jgi:hypothetical protein